MFTGLVQAIGRVESLQGERLVISPESTLGDDLIQLGESIAINGCCLTVVAQERGLAFDLSTETLRRTNLGALQAGARVNLERAMRLGDRLGGHVVQGHVDAVATLESIETLPDSWRLVVRPPVEGARYLIDKGSVTLDGISLTVVRPDRETFEVHIIPHTWEHTNLKERKVGDVLNLEYDVLAKHVERLLAFR